MKVSVSQHAIDRAAVIRANTRRLAELSAKIAELDRELYEAKRQKSTIAKSCVAYL